jgi:hypothetical protein
LIYSRQTLDSAKSLIDSVGFFKIAHNGFGIGEEGAFEKRQLGLCNKAK